jgi:hypothetical protein
MRPGWDATRRNRNQGTAKRGLGQDNRMVVPCTLRSGRPFYEQLRSAVIVERGIPATLRFYVEPPRADSRHACSIDDIVTVLRRLPSEDTKSLAAIVLRQPTRKQAILRPVWGRMIYSTSLARVSGPAIFLEAQLAGLRWMFPLSTRPEDEQELDRLRRDGHKIDRDRRAWRIESSPDAIRSTQLYRTLLHEIGHHVDRLTHLRRSVSEDQFFARPSREREEAAHRYANHWAERLRASGNIPFARILKPEALRRDGLSEEWFVVE